MSSLQIVQTMTVLLDDQVYVAGMRNGGESKEGVCHMT